MNQDGPDRCRSGWNTLQARPAPKRSRKRDAWNQKTMTTIRCFPAGLDTAMKRWIWRKGLDRTLANNFSQRVATIPGNGWKRPVHRTRLRNKLAAGAIAPANG